MAVFKEYDDYDALGLAGLVKRKAVNSKELCEEAILRIESWNPAINAVIYKMYDEARQKANEKLPEGPFAGVPFVIKDLLAAYAGVPFTSGCKALKKFIPDYDAEIVNRFKKAGLITIAKTNTPEFGLMAITEPELFGPTRNPWNLERTPGGSSGGAAAAVAAGIVPMASAGDGGGSIRIPAGNCGLFGLKPTRGRVPSGPRKGEVWQGAAIQHVISRTVRDSAAMLDAVHGALPGDPYIIKHPAGSYLSELEKEPDRLKIGFSIAHPLGSEVHKDCIEATYSAARTLENLGHIVEEVKLPYDGKMVANAYLTMYFGEVAAEVDNLENVLGRKPRPTDVEPSTWLLRLLGYSYSAAEFVRAKHLWNVLSRSMSDYHATYDLLLTPTTAFPPIRIGELALKPAEKRLINLVNTFGLGNLLKRSGIAMEIAEKSLAKTPYTQIANLTGQPAMSVPLYWSSEGLPCGVQFIGRFAEEDVLLKLAAQLERAHPWFNKRPVLAQSRVS